MFSYFLHISYILSTSSYILSTSSYILSTYFLPNLHSTYFLQFKKPFLKLGPEPKPLQFHGSGSSWAEKGRLRLQLQLRLRNPEHIHSSLFLGLQLSTNKIRDVLQVTCSTCLIVWTVPLNGSKYSHKS